MRKDLHETSVSRFLAEALMQQFTTVEENIQNDITVEISGLINSSKINYNLLYEYLKEKYNDLLLVENEIKAFKNSLNLDENIYIFWIK